MSAPRDPGDSSGSHHPPGPPRILALDVGSKTIGLAVSDPLGITAQGLETLRRRNKRSDLEQLRRVLKRFDIREIVVGYPLRMSGAESGQTEKVTRFAEQLRQRFQLPVHLWDERLTTVAAHELGPAERDDEIAAAIILQEFLDARRR